MTEEQLLDEAQIINVPEDTNSEEEVTYEEEEILEEVTEEEEVVEEPKPEPKKPLDKFAKKLAELNEAKKQNELLKIERDVALIKAKYGNDVDEAKIQEIRLKHKDLSMEEVYAIYSHSSPKSTEEVKPRQQLKVVWQKPAQQTRVFTYEDLSNKSQSEYNQVMDLVRQGKAVVKQQ